MGELELGAAAEATVLAYKELANDPTKRLTLATDQTCIQFLAYIIAEGTGTLIQSAVDTLQLLSDSADCRVPLANTFGVIEALQAMADDARYSDELRNQTARLFTCLQFSKHVKTTESKSINKDEIVLNKSENDKKTQKGEKTKRLSSKLSFLSDESLHEKAGLSLITDSSKSKPSEKSFLGPYNSRAKTVTLQIEHLKTQADRIKIEERLLRVRGLISLVFDINRHRVTVRARKDLSLAILAKPVAGEGGGRVDHVITGQDGKEVLFPISLDGGPVPSPSRRSPPLPDYLPEDQPDSPGCESESGSAVAVGGEGIRGAAANFISAAASLIHNSFYW